MSARRVIRVGEYILKKKIGEGSFATVFKAYHERTKKPVAIKKMSLSGRNKKELANLESEIVILQSLKHPNIVELIGFERNEKYIYLILEYCGGGDLSKYIRENGPLPEKDTKRFMRQLARGLLFLRSKSLIHRDLKPQNLLLTHNRPDGVLKIADFGFARHLGSTKLAQTMCGSPLYMAPEVLKGQSYDEKADLWSVGVIVFEMLTRRVPFTGENQIQLLYNIEHQELRLPSSIQVSEDAIRFLQLLLQRHPATRASFDRYFAATFLGMPSLAESMAELRASTSGPPAATQSPLPPKPSDSGTIDRSERKQASIEPRAIGHGELAFSMDERSHLAAQSSQRRNSVDGRPGPQVAAVRRERATTTGVLRAPRSLGGVARLGDSDDFVFVEEFEEANAGSVAGGGVATRRTTGGTSARSGTPKSVSGHSAALPAETGARPQHSSPAGHQQLPETTPPAQSTQPPAPPRQHRRTRSGGHVTAEDRFLEHPSPQSAPTSSGVRTPPYAPMFSGTGYTPRTSPSTGLSGMTASSHALLSCLLDSLGHAKAVGRRACAVACLGDAMVGMGSPNSGSVQATMNPAVAAATPPQDEAAVALQQRYALLITMKALALFRRGILDTQRALEYSQSLADALSSPVHSPSTSPSMPGLLQTPPICTQTMVQLRSVLRSLQDYFSAYLDKADHLRAQLRKPKQPFGPSSVAQPAADSSVSSLANSSSSTAGPLAVTAEQLIYNAALHLGRGAGVKEMLGKTSSSCEEYAQAVLLLEALCMADSLHDSDRAVLDGYRTGFSLRLDALLAISGATTSALGGAGFRRSPTTTVVTASQTPAGVSQPGYMPTVSYSRTPPSSHPYLGSPPLLSGLAATPMPTLMLTPPAYPAQQHATPLLKPPSTAEKIHAVPRGPRAAIPATVPHSVEASSTQPQDLPSVAPTTSLYKDSISPPQQATGDLSSLAVLGELELAGSPGALFPSPIGMLRMESEM